MSEKYQKGKRTKRTQGERRREKVKDIVRMMSTKERAWKRKNEK